MALGDLKFISAMIMEISHHTQTLTHGAPFQNKISSHNTCWLANLKHKFEQVL